MKIKMIRASGNPVSPEKADEKQKAWEEGFDALTKKHGKYGEEINKALDGLERELENKYNDLSVIDVELPKSAKAWKELASEYGNIMITTSIEDNKYVKSGDIIFVVNDMPF
jgi:predicted nuclease with TOPRIM domain